MLDDEDAHDLSVLPPAINSGDHLGMLCYVIGNTTLLSKSCDSFFPCRGFFSWKLASSSAMPGVRSWNLYKNRQNCPFAFFDEGKTCGPSLNFLREEAASYEWIIVL